MIGESGSLISIGIFASKLRTPRLNSAGEIGFKANIQFIRGTPPYAFHYRFYQKGHSPKTFVKDAIYATRETIAIKPQQPGTYIFVSEELLP
jgi:hypothetical protein